MSQGTFLVVKCLPHSAASRTLLSVLWHHLITPVGTNGNTNADQKNSFKWSKKDEELNVKEEAILYPLYKSLLDLWNDNKRGKKALVWLKSEAPEFCHCFLKHSQYVCSQI